MTSRQRWILATALVTQAFAVGLTHGIFPVFLVPLEKAFAAPRTVIATGSVLMMIALCASGLVTGMLFDRGHARRVMLGGAVLLASALALAARAPNLPVLALAAVLMGMSVPPLGPLSGATLVTRFFAHERGRALGWVGMGPPLGAGIFAGLAGVLLTHFEWRSVLLVFALAVVAVLWPLIWIAIPARFETHPVEGNVAIGTFGDPRASKPFWRRPVFWSTAAMFALAAGIATGWTAHFVAFLGGQGVDDAMRTGLLSIQFWMAVPASFVFGALGDRRRPTGLLLAILAGQGAILAAYAMTTATDPFAPGVFVVLGAAAGFLSGGLVPLFLLLLASRIAAASFSRALAVSNLLMLPAMSASVLLAARDFEWSGNYQRALVGLAAGHLVAIACLLGSNRMRTTT